MIKRGLRQRAVYLENLANYVKSSYAPSSVTLLSEMIPKYHHPCSVEGTEENVVRPQDNRRRQRVASACGRPANKQSVVIFCTMSEFLEEKHFALRLQ